MGKITSSISASISDDRSDLSDVGCITGTDRMRSDQISQISGYVPDRKLEVRQERSEQVSMKQHEGTRTQQEGNTVKKK